MPVVSALWAHRRAFLFCLWGGAGSPVSCSSCDFVRFLLSDSVARNCACPVCSGAFFAVCSFFVFAFAAILSLCFVVCAFLVAACADVAVWLCLYRGLSFLHCGYLKGSEGSFASDSTPSCLSCWIGCFCISLSSLNVAQSRSGSWHGIIYRSVDLPGLCQCWSLSESSGRFRSHARRRGAALITITASQL